MVANDTSVKRHVLIVDDNEDLRDLIKATLGLSIYDIGVAANGQEALSYLQNVRVPDLIILDVAMPVMDGLQFLQKIREQPQYNSTKVIVLSAQLNNQQLEELKQKGATAIINKPFGPLDLLRKLDTLFE